jgi:MoxR-like ATPase
MVIDPQASTPLARLRQVAHVLGGHFVDRDELIRLMILSTLASEPLLLLGPPGTAKSALISGFSQLVSARYFEYLLTRFSEPSELLGPLDIAAFREGHYRRRSEGMLPTAQLVFLDEIFKANSAILNSLLGLLNERRLHIGSERVDVPLIALFAASNEVPTDENLDALLDRFTVRMQTQNLEGHHFDRLLKAGLAHAAGQLLLPQPLLHADELLLLQAQVRARLDFSPDFLTVYKDLIFQLRGEGIPVSDRRAVRLLKLCAASALLEDRHTASLLDLHVLRYAWNRPEQRELVHAIVEPVLDKHRRAHPSGAPSLQHLDDLAAEFARLRRRLAQAAELSDVQLFACLRALSALRSAYASQPGELTSRALADIDRLLDDVLSARRAG